MVNAWSKSGWDQNTYEKGNAQTCSTRLESKLTVRPTAYGVSLDNKKVDGVIVYPDVQPGYRIEWAAQTSSDGSGEPDRITAKLARLDTVYLAGIIDSVTATMPNANEETLMTAIIEQVDPPRLFSTLATSTVTTGSDGHATGVLDTQGAPPGPALITIHYGYSSRSERSDSSKKWEFWSKELMEEVLAWMIAAAVCGGAVAAAAATGGLAAPLAAGACALGVALAVAAARMYQEYAKDAWGLIDTNNDGCTFPLGGHNHIYSLALGGDIGALESASGITPQATESSLSDSAVRVRRSKRASQLLPLILIMGAMGLGLGYLLSQGSKGGDGDVRS
jgi:hypothetical protein